MTVDLIAVLVFVWIAFGVVGYVVASRRGRDDPGEAAVTAFLLGPIGLLPAFSRRPEETRRICANCGKPVRRNRKQLCNHCGLPFESRVEAVNDIRENP
jgi:ribosomal protein L37E